MNQTKNILVFFLICTLFFSCKKDNRTQVSKGFYYWKSKLHLHEENRKMLGSLAANKLYVKFFDVDWDEGSENPRPHASLRPEGILDTSIKIVPTVFITNRTMEKLTEEWKINYLASNVYKKVTHLANCFDSEIKIEEIQIDCDWSEATRDVYFKFLTALKKEMVGKEKLSATIRLHQVKYFQKTGVPPVDRGMLMFYNMGKVDKLFPGNSIYNKEDASKYLVQFEHYPLRLDVALPIFSWAAIYRDKKLVHLLTDFESNLREHKNLIKVDEEVYKVVKPIDLKTIYIKQGDIVKFEVMDADKTKEAAELIQPHMKDSITVVLFDLNDLNMKRYHEEDLEDIFTTFN
jgi:hypothetical protein